MRLMRASALILTLFLFFPVSAAQDKVLDEWLYWDGSTAVHDTSVSVQLNDANDVLRVVIGDDSTIVTVDSCKETLGYEVCFEERSDEEKPDIDDSGQLRPGVRLVIYEQEGVVTDGGGSPSMSISQTTTGTTLTGDHTLTLVLENTGEGAMFNFSASATPFGVEASNDQEDILQVGDNTYRVTGGVEAGDNKTIVLDYEPTRLDPYTQIDYSYDSTSDGRVTGTANRSIAVDDAMSTSVVTPSTAELFEETTITTTVTNNVDSQLTAQIVSNQWRNQILEGSAYSASDKGVGTMLNIPFNETETVELTYQPRYTGDTTVETRINGSVAGFTPNTSYEQTISTPEPAFTTDVSVSTTEPGGNATIDVVATNANKYVLDDVDLTADSQYGRQSYDLGNVSPETTEEHAFTYDVPFGARPGNHTLDLTTSYATIADEQFQTSQQRTLELRRNEYDIVIDKTISDTAPMLNDTVMISVYVENTGDNTLYNATISDEATESAVNESTTTTLSTGERVRAYQYNMTYAGKTTLSTRVTSGQFTHTSYQTLVGETQAGLNATNQSSSQKQSRETNASDTVNRSAQPTTPNTSNGSIEETNTSESDASFIEQTRSVFRYIVRGVSSLLP
jgi:hypothetical protein